MSFPGFYSLASAWLFLLLIPLIIFYFLKLKRPRMEVPSLALWQQVINDRRVNSPFQKFKRNLLLLLQLLLLMLLVLAVMQPFIHSGAKRAQYLPVLIDCSASMAALDQPGGQSRLALAKIEVAKLIDDMLPDQRFSLIAVHSTARRLTDFTDNKRLLREALDKITVSDVPSNLEDALRMTQALARTVSIETVIIYSDGNFPSQVDFELPFQLNYQQLPLAGANIGITAFNARRSQAETWDVFIRVAGTTQSQTAADIELLKDGSLVGEETVVLEKGKSQRLVFSIDADRVSSLEVRLKPDGFDSLESDNVAFLELPQGRPLSVYTPAELVTYRHALGANKNVDLFPKENGTSEESAYDVVITDRLPEQTPEATVRVFVGVIPDDLKKLIVMKTGLAEIVDWKRSSPLLRHVQLDGIQISDVPTPLASPSSKGGDAGEVRDGEYEELGYEILAHSRSGPLILKKRSGAKVAFFLLFHTDRSTFPYRVGFPILVANVVQLGLLQAELSEVRGQSTQVLPAKTLEPDRSYRITAPDGSQHDAQSNADGILSGIPAPLVGRYTIRAAGTDVARVGVSLFNETETSLSAVEKIQFRELSVSASEAQIKSDRPLWQTFAFLAFGMLLVEWWFYQRRPGGVPTS